MSVLELNVYSRDKKGAKVKQEGYLPGVIYGSPKGKNISIKYNEFERFYNKLHGEVSAITLILDGKEKISAIIKEIQKNSIGTVFKHVDFQPLEQGHAITVEVPVVLKGTAKGIKEGGLLEQMLHKVKIETIPSKLVELVELDVTNLAVGESLHIKDINIDGVKVIGNELDVIVVIGGKSSGEASEEGESSEA